MFYIKHDLQLHELFQQNYFFIRPFFNSMERTLSVLSGLHCVAKTGAGVKP